MTSDGLEDDVRQLLFAAIDSVEQLEVLLLLWNHRNQAWTEADVDRELRSNLTSISKRLQDLVSIGMVEQMQTSVMPTFRYASPNVISDATMTNLAVAYRDRRHCVLRTIFLPSKKARGFANAFIVGDCRKKGDDHG